MSTLRVHGAAEVSGHVSAPIARKRLPPVERFFSRELFHHFYLFGLTEVNGLACHNPSLLGTGVDPAEARSIIKGFCALNDGARLASAANVSSIYKTATGNSDLYLTISLSEATETSEARCSGAAATISLSTCEQNLFRLLDECDTDRRSSGKHGGNVTSGCEVYGMSTKIEEIIRCGGNPWSRPTDLPLDIMSDGINAYCGTSLDLTPDYMPNDRFLTGPSNGQSFDNFIKHEYVVKTVTQFSGQGQTECSTSKPFNTKGEECRRKLQAIKDQCGGQGGGLSENGVNGCVLWTIWGQHAH
ncbi:hypothetical protein AC578_4751 [Pseudocercospora eumusae]|uniref:Uncharacterized protein n=1 Tax=Pseudocercospora eumusae TaxID=321146 RepID=A0A139HL79_9PEZI|nr:hypothetical protein AC578_4751 [Pseudocercospora eumusae]